MTNAQYKRHYQDKGMQHKKKQEVLEKMSKIHYLEEIRLRQAMERKEFVRRQQE